MVPRLAAPWFSDRYRITSFARTTACNSCPSCRPRLPKPTSMRGASGSPLDPPSHGCHGHRAGQEGFDLPRVVRRHDGRSGDRPGSRPSYARRWLDTKRSAYTLGHIQSSPPSARNRPDWPEHGKLGPLYGLAGPCAPPSTTSPKQRNEPYVRGHRPLHAVAVCETYDRGDLRVTQEARCQASGPRVRSLAGVQGDGFQPQPLSNGRARAAVPRHSDCAWLKATC